jgi:hypothetical protein
VSIYNLSVGITTMLNCMFRMTYRTSFFLLDFRQERSKYASAFSDA